MALMRAFPMLIIDNGDLKSFEEATKSLDHESWMQAMIEQVVTEKEQDMATSGYIQRCSSY